MPKEYFQFKQFRINQDRCSMKVCTDSCLFGAWLARKTETKFPVKILDIGTGTGLLSLMAAQKTGAIIHAIDIDGNAILQAEENFQLSPWNTQLQVFYEDVKHWNTDANYDCIMSNPPFFENDLLPEEPGKKNSKHDSALKLTDLIVAVDQLLSIDGFFTVLLPYARADYFEKEAIKYSLFVNEKLHIKQSMKHGYFRTILMLERKQNPLRQSEISISNNDNEYTSEFIALLKDYYLYL